MKPARSKLTYANVMATVAVFLVLPVAPRSPLSVAGASMHL
jgi:hypothetical protein